jgi:hypothetical protein
VNLILADIHKELTKAGRGENSRAARTTMLGGSREAVIDTIRHIRKPAWRKLLAQLSNNDIAVSTTKGDKGSVRSRAIAEQLFADVQRADTDPDNKGTMAALVLALTNAAPASHQKLIDTVARRIVKRTENATA